MERFSPDASVETLSECDGKQARPPAATRRGPAPVPPENQLPLDDPERMGELFARLEPRLHAVALRITRHREASRDAVQNAYEKVLRHGHRFAGRSRVSTWMHRIVANEALMWLRTQRRRPEIEADLDLDALERQPAPGPCPAEQASGRQRAAQLERGISALPLEDRDVMLRCALAGESYSDYAARTGLQPAAVKSRAFRARRRLAAFLEESCGVESP